MQNIKREPGEDRKSILLKRLSSCQDINKHVLTYVPD